MIIRKKTILAVAVMVMLAGVNSSVFACTDTEGKCGDFTAFTNSQVEKAMAEMNKALAEMNKSLGEMKKVHNVYINTKAQANTPANEGATKPAVPAQTAKPAVPAQTAKPAVSVPTAKPAIPVSTANPAVSVPTAKPAIPVSTANPAVPIETVKPAVPAETVNPAVEIDRVKAAAELAAKAAVEAAMGKGYYGTNLNVVNTDTSTYVIDQDNGDEIATTYDPETKVTNISIKRPRKDAPDNFIQTSITETAALIVADGDIFNCDVGFYGNSISPVSLTPEYKSSYKIDLKNSSVMTGEVNNNDKIQNVLLTMDKTSKWIVKGTSYLSALEDEDKTLSNIVDNGNTIYYDASIDSNNWLGGKTYKLSGGGELTPKK